MVDKERLQRRRNAMCTSSLGVWCPFYHVDDDIKAAYLREMRMRNGRKVRMKRRKLATDPDVAFFMMTERRKVNMMMEVP